MNQRISLLARLASPAQAVWLVHRNKGHEVAEKVDILSNGFVVSELLRAGIDRRT